MKSLKNNALDFRGKKSLCKTHNGKKQLTQKVKLTMYKSYNYVKTYHPLKRKKIKLHKFKFVSGVNHSDSPEDIKILKIEGKGNSILSKRYCTNTGKTEKSGRWSNQEEIINWLASVDVKVKRINAFQFLLENRICKFNYIAIFANKKRLELGLSPFYIEGITEY